MSIVWLPSTLRDVRELRAYISQSDPGAAAVVLSRIRASVETPDQFPMLGRPGRGQRTRELAVPRTPYVVHYQIVEDSIEIVRVLHGAQQWPPTP